MLYRGIKCYNATFMTGLQLAIVWVFLFGLVYYITLNPKGVSSIPRRNLQFEKLITGTGGGEVSSNSDSTLAIVKRGGISTKDNHLTIPDFLENTDDVVRNRFFVRNQIIKNVCRKFPFLQKNASQLLPLAKQRLSWCRTYKVASSFILSLDKNVRTEINGDVSPQNFIAKRFMVVREPYSRLVSAYIDRILTFPPEWAKHGTRIIRKFRLNATASEISCGRNVTFPEFIKFFIHSQKSGWMRDVHFDPMTESCNPCHVDFDFTCHLETLTEDLSFILKSINITHQFDMGVEESTFQAKVKRIFTLNETVTRCQTMCDAFLTLWWAFQSRGLLPRGLPFPLSEADCSKDLKEAAFGDICWQTYQQHVGKFDKDKEMRKTIVELFLQVPLEDRIQVRDLLAPDFELFGYEAQPDDIFPELAREIY